MSDNPAFLLFLGCFLDSLLKNMIMIYDYDRPFFKNNKDPQKYNPG